jgi:hypothetical protein
MKGTSSELCQKCRVVELVGDLTQVSGMAKRAWKGQDKRDGWWRGEFKGVALPPRWNK